MKVRFEDGVCGPVHRQLGPRALPKPDALEREELAVVPVAEDQPPPLLLDLGVPRQYRSGRGTPAASFASPARRL